MIGAFNPYMAGNSPQSPNISLDTVSRLLGGANEGIQSLVGGIQKAGEIDRSSKVNELLATGGLKGLTEEQARQKIAQMTGGQSINPIVSANVQDILSGQKAREIAKADTLAKLGLEEFKFGNEMTKLDKEGTQKQSLEKLKSELGLSSDMKLEEVKNKYASSLLGQRGAQDKDLASYESQLKTALIDQNKLPDRFMSMGSGMVLDRVTGEVKLNDMPKDTKSQDIFKSLSPEAEKYARNLTKNQQENLAEMIKNGSVGFQPYAEDKKTGAKSGGFFYDVDNPTGIGISISNKKK